MEELEITPKSNETTKVSQSSFNMSFSPSNPDEFPIVYSDDVWDIAEIGSKLAELIDNTGTYDQHALNELFAATVPDSIPDEEITAVIQ